MPVFRDDLLRWQQLITPTWLARLTAGRAVSAAPAAHWCLLEVGWGASDAFFQCHIPGAAYLDTACLRSTPSFDSDFCSGDLIQVGRAAPQI